MTDWSPEEAARLDREDELGLSSRRPDGTLRPFITIWFVRHGDEVIVRSAYGPANGWYRRALASGPGGSASPASSVTSPSTLPITVPMKRTPRRTRPSTAATRKVSSPP